MHVELLSTLELVARTDGPWPPTFNRPTLLAGVSSGLSVAGGRRTEQSRRCFHERPTGCSVRQVGPYIRRSRWIISQAGQRPELVVLRGKVR